MKKILWFSRQRINIVLLISVFLIGVDAYSQEIIVKGVVISADDEGVLPGVSIVVKGGTSGTTTNFDGDYEITADASSTLIFSYLGFQTIEIEVNNRSNIDVRLESDVTQLEDVVVIGYGTQRKKDVTGAVGSLKAEDFNQGSVVGPEELLRGRVAGVNISNVSSAPGAGANVRIRGGTSITASNEPLYVIDGFPIDNGAIDPGSSLSTTRTSASNPLSMINPADIESIDILKDASATAIYGSRGANGVVIITTKKGSAGRMQVNYEGFTGVSQAINTLDIFSPEEFIEETNRVTPGTIDPDTAARTDWFDEVTRSAISHSHTLSVSGGSESSSYSASVGYFDQEGIVKNSGIERLTSRIKLNHKSLNDKLKISINLLGSYSDLENLAAGSAGTTGEGGVINNAIKAPPSDPIFNADGTFFPSSLLTTDNPVAVLGIADNTQASRVLGNLVASLSLTESLELEGRFGGDRNIGKRASYNPTTTRTGERTGGRADIRQRTRSSILGEVFFKYDKQFGENHRLNALLGYSYQDFTFEAFGATGTGFPTDAISFYNLGLGESGGFSANPPFSTWTKNRLISGIFRANYSYKDKYLFTATYRKDGSTRFSENNKWGNFPSISAAWRISEEGFLTDSEVVSDLKLRLGWGVTGSQEIPSNRSLNTFGPAGNKFNAELGSVFVTGIAQNNVGNENLTWEETTSTNLGLDFGFANGKISGSIDVYRKDTDGLLLEAALPSPSVASTRLVNIGEVRNQGIEFSLSSLNVDREEFTWSTDFNLSHNKNEILRLANNNADVISGGISGAGLSGTTTQILRVGEELGSFYGRVFTGVDPATGKEQFKDVDGDGDTDGEDREIIGSAQPDLILGLNNSFKYKNWDFSFFMQARLGIDMLYVQRLELRTVGATNTFRDYADYWTPENTGAQYPALGEPRVFHSGIIESGDFLKMSNLTLGYKLSADNIQWLKAGRLYVTVQNAFIITNYSGFNPEVNVSNLGGETPAGLPTIGVDTNGYPLARTINIGLQFTL
ncbi:TonB-dependent receptor [Zobellia galactanivorans]|uniref:SusC/RagA family TonB-linked outer membrane protein n=1 Tax=Zobellia TaxID=112040 RepID=UPI0026E3BF2E|nr:MULTISPECIES: TonB-dependent receptor [Zobellia]MDO6519561.1 TonB-dependent receptor [Zobellia uliginosa]MDO6810473.1 TonB-dependent receptor [Zobellia galactanivorans]